MAGWVEAQPQRQVENTLISLWIRDDFCGSMATSPSPAWETQALGLKKKTSPGCGEKVGVLRGGCGNMHAAVFKIASKYVGTLYLKERE